MVTLGKLVASCEDFGHYTHYVFEVLEEDLRKQTKYILCTMFPRWESVPITIGEVGFVEFVEIKAGITTWYDKECNQQIPYNYDMVQFIRFVRKPIEDNQEYIIQINFKNEYYYNKL